MQAQRAPQRDLRPVSIKRTAARRDPRFFTRWLVVVYLPLGLLASGFVLFVSGALPGWGGGAMVLLSAWGLVSIRLLRERKRRGVSVPPPRSMVVGFGITASTAFFGGMLSWIGVARLQTNAGVIMLYAGAFLVLVAVLAPMFKVIDSILRAAGRILFRRTAGQGER